MRAAASTQPLGVFKSREDLRMSLWVHWKERKGGRSLYLLDVPFELAFLLVGIVIVLLLLVMRRFGLL